MFVSILSFLIGLPIVIKAADWLVDGASDIARRFRISDLVIGLTVVAFGTSAPELIVNVISAIQGTPELAIGNILGSNSANILLILGVSALIYPLSVGKGTVWKEIPFSLLAVLLLWVMANDVVLDGMAVDGLTRTDGLGLLALFVIFIYYTFGIAFQGKKAKLEPATMSLWAAGLAVFGGLVGLVLGGKLIVDGAVAIATGFGVSTSLIGLTIVAVGTSLPELATSIVAARKHKADIAVGNVVGSNIFNIFFILGISAVIAPLPVQPSTQADIAMVVFATLLLFATFFIGKRHTLDRWQGAVMVACYAAYIVFLVMRG